MPEGTAVPYQPATSAASPLRLENLGQLTPDAAALARNRIIGFDSRDIRSRPFNLLRTSFSKKLKETGARLVGITSATPAAGKSFLSLNLAASLARVAEEPVFLVDLDIRRASLGEELGFKPEFGTESFLSGDIDRLEQFGFSIEGTRLGVFPTVRRARNTAEMLSDRNYSRLIQAFRDRSGSSIVLFDMPPAFASDDTMISLEKLDGYVLVVDSGKTTRTQIEDVVDLLHPTPCLGSILNRYRGGFGDPYGYGYGGNEYARYYT